MLSTTKMINEGCMVINISKYSPQHKDRLFVDTNVWFWLTYAGSREIDSDSAPKRYQLEDYPHFINSVLDAGARLFHCSLTLAEIANVIERTEYEIYCSELGKKISRKEFRKIPAQKDRVTKEIESAWSTIKKCSENLDSKLCKKFTEEAFDLFRSSNVDAYDAFFIEIMKQNEILSILTDDADFLSVAGQSVFTANKNAFKN